MCDRHSAEFWQRVSQQNVKDGNNSNGIVAFVFCTLPDELGLACSPTRVTVRAVAPSILRC